jgi:maleylpyruvate isomerase
MRAPLHADPEPEAVPAFLSAVDAATERLRSVLEPLPDDELRAPSRLPGWSRATVLAHLRHVAGASVRVVDEALAGQPTAFYPGGREEREASLVVPDDQPLRALVDELFEASDRLAERWQAMSADDWRTDLREPRFGLMRLSRLAPLRLSEVELHSVDLGLDSLTEWSDEAVELLLPLRIAWLPNHARTLPTADMSVNGRWLLQGDARAWLISTAGSLASASQVDSSEELGSVDCAIAGSDRQILGFVLGRTPVDELMTYGDDKQAASFKAAFPGP